MDKPVITVSERIQLLNRLVHVISFQKIEALDGGCHSLLSTQLILFNPKDFGMASYAHRNYRKLIRKGHEKLDFFVLNNWQVGIKEDARGTDITGPASNSKSAIGENECHRQLEGKPLRETPILAQGLQFLPTV